MENKNEKGVQTISTFCPSSYLPWGTKQEQVSFINDKEENSEGNEA